MPEGTWLNHLGISGVRRAAWFLRGFFFATAFRTPGRDNRPPASQVPKETHPCPPSLEPPAPEEKRKPCLHFWPGGVCWDRVGRIVNPSYKLIGRAGRAGFE